MAKKDYIDNKALYAEFVKWRKAIEVSKEAGKPSPQMPHTIARAVMTIAERLSQKKNFASISFRDEMVGDAIEICVRYAKSFDPERSNNPFGYLTTLCYNSFVRRIHKENVQEYTRIKYEDGINMFEESEHITGTPHYRNTIVSIVENKLAKETEKRNEKKGMENE